MQGESVTNPFQGRVMFNSVYLVECSRDDEPHIRHSRAPIAIRPRIDLRAQNATWETNSSRSEYISWDKVEGIARNQPVESQGISEQEVGIINGGGPDRILLSKENHSLRLVKLTRELFDEKVRPYVAGGANLSFASDEELQKFYLSTNFER